MEKFLIVASLALVALDCVLFGRLMSIESRIKEQANAAAPKQCQVEIAWPQKQEAVVYVGEWK